MQIIYYGVPGTGKSFQVDKYLCDNNVSSESIFRVTFHPEYTYSDFVGQLIPTVIKNGPNKGDVSYTYSKGIFTQALEKAYEDLSKNIFLVIEEMSRGNCAAIFGDLFQLLDREKTGIQKGYSRYFINNDIIAKDIIAIQDDRIKLPPNFHILGTVNTSDQNVYVMDNAFKRRFNWKYIGTEPISSPDGSPINDFHFELNDGQSMVKTSWVYFYQILNKFITSDKFMGLSEDKQIGQFFIETDDQNARDEIQDKLLNYLWFDVNQSSYKSDVRLFDRKITCFSELYDCFDNDKKCFSDEFIDLFKHN